MKGTMKIGLTVASIALVSVFASAQTDASAPPQANLTNSIQVTVDGTPVTFPAAQPQMAGGRVLVPLRGVFEQIGANVDWDPNTQSIMIDGGGRHIRLQIGSFDAEVDGHAVEMDVAPQIIHDSTMVPLRFLSQSMGDRVDWQPQNELVAITTMARAQRFLPPAQEPAPPPPAPVVVTPPPPAPIIVRPNVIVTEPSPPPPAPAPEMATIAATDVIPMRLDAGLSSEHSQPGDHFTASVRDAGVYWEFPEGTVVEGIVESATPATATHGGMLDLRFTHIRFPDGNRYRLNGAVVPLDSKYVVRTREGHFIARTGQEYAVAQDNNADGGAGLLLGAYSGAAFGGSALGGTLGNVVGVLTHSSAHNLIFPAGARLGLILGRPLNVDRRDLRFE